MNDLRDIFLSQFQESDKITLPEVQHYYKSYKAFVSKSELELSVSEAMSMCRKEAKQRNRQYII